MLYLNASIIRLRNESRSGGSLVLESRWELLLLDVVPGETVDTGLDENHPAKTISDVI